MISVEAEVFDFNRDSLRYQWYMDEQLLAGDESSVFELSGMDFSLGSHVLKLRISDSVNEIEERWQVDILDNITWLGATSSTSLYRCSLTPLPIRSQ